MRKIALLTAAFTFAFSGVALAATTWYGGATQSGDMSTETGQLGVDIGLNGSKKITRLDVNAFLNGGGSCFTGSVTAHGLTWKINHGSFKGTKTSQGVTVTISGKVHSYGLKGSYTVTQGSCTSGKVSYTARYEIAPNF